MTWKPITISENKGQLRKCRGQNMERGVSMTPWELRWERPATAWTSWAEETSQGPKTTVIKWHKKTHCRLICKRPWSSIKRSKIAWKVLLWQHAGSSRQSTTTEKCRGVTTKIEAQMQEVQCILNPTKLENQNGCWAWPCRIAMWISKIWRSRMSWNSRSISLTRMKMSWFRRENNCLRRWVKKSCSAASVFTNCKALTLYRWPLIQRSHQRSSKAEIQSQR